jgi:glucose/arabinose dehydrogenase
VAGRRRLLAIVAAGVTLGLAAGVIVLWQQGFLFTNPSVDDAREEQLPSSAVETVAIHLLSPWGLAFLPDGTALITERNTAKIKSISVGLDRSVSDVQQLSEVVPGGEGGLLGIAVGPDYATDKWVYVYYTAADDNRVARLRLGGAPEPILTGIPKAGNHDGGRIAFGPDGMLYVGTGDAAIRDNAQDLSSLGGKILRITPDGKPAPGNPFPDSPVYSYGHRNVQGLAWSAEGQLYATEFGQNRYDELNRIEPGRNYGWPIVEGLGDDARFANPVATWSPSEASPSGLAIVDGKAWLACLRGERLYRIGLDGSDPTALLVDDYGRLRHVARAPDGSLWVLTSNRDGRGDPVSADDRIIRITLP